MSKQKTVVQIVRTFDPSKFSDTRFPKSSPSMSRLNKLAEIMEKNLWSMFQVPEDAKERKLSVSDFMWTDEVREQFYNWGFHRQMVAYMERNGRVSFAMWKLNVQPANEREDVIVDPNMSN